MSKLKVTPAAAFRQETELLQLPSGRVVEVKEVDLIALVQGSPKEEVPDFISGRVMDMVSGKSNRAMMNEANDAQDVFGLVDLVVRASVVTPQVVKDNANYEAGQINIGDLNTMEKIKIFEVCMPFDEVSAATSFRDRIQAANVDAVRDGEDNGQPSESNSGDTE